MRERSLKENKIKEDREEREKQTRIYKEKLTQNTKARKLKEEETQRLKEEDQRLKDQEEQRLKGEVKWFNEAKGYGFIKREGEEKDIFVHLSAVKNAGLKYLRVGEQLTFEIENTDKGLSAINLQKTS